jgi:hypothetical protein
MILSITRISFHRPEQSDPDFGSKPARSVNGCCWLGDGWISSNKSCVFNTRLTLKDFDN